MKITHRTIVTSSQDDRFKKAAPKFDTYDEDLDNLEDIDASFITRKKDGKQFILDAAEDIGNQINDLMQDDGVSIKLGKPQFYVEDKNHIEGDIGYFVTVDGEPLEYMGSGQPDGEIRLAIVFSDGQWNKGSDASWWKADSYVSEIKEFINEQFESGDSSDETDELIASCKLITL